MKMAFIAPLGGAIMPLLWNQTKKDAAVFEVQHTLRGR